MERIGYDSRLGELREEKEREQDLGSMVWKLASASAVRKLEFEPPKLVNWPRIESFLLKGNQPTPCTLHLHSTP